MSDHRYMELPESDYDVVKALGYGDVYVGLERIVAWARVRIAWYNEAGNEGFPGFIAEITNMRTVRERELEEKLLAAQAEIVELRQLLGDLAHAADSDDWEYTWVNGERKGLLDRIYEALGEKR